MPRRSGKPPAKGGHQLCTKSDFTVYDYAHNGIGSGSNSKASASGNAAPASTRRMKKAVANAWRTEANGLRGQSGLQEQQLIVESVDVDDMMNHETNTVCVTGNIPTNKTTTCVLDNDNFTSVIYPLDVWFLISEYIRPEDVSVFARICHFTHVVVHSARFWFSLYNRFCRLSPGLPESLQASYVARCAHGLRARVVRALYHVYKPLSSQLVSALSLPSSGTTHSADAQSLVGLRCTMFWYEHLPKCQWRFYFRFQRGSGKRSCTLSSNGRRLTDPLLAPADVMHNPDEHSVVLVAASPHFVALPIVLGQVLIQGSFSTGVQTHYLRLIFCAEYVHANRANVAGATVVSLDPVINVRIMH